MRKSYLSNLMILAAAMNGDFPYKEVNTPKRKILTDNEKQRSHKEYAAKLHKYVIKGAEITAPNKKAAIKIYNLKSNGTETRGNV